MAEMTSVLKNTAKGELLFFSPLAVKGVNKLKIQLVLEMYQTLDCILPRAENTDSNMVCMHINILSRKILH